MTEDTQYTSRYHSPLGELLLAGDGTGLTGIWFADQKHFALTLRPGYLPGNLPVFERAAAWLDLYFQGKNPGFLVPVHLLGTPFQMEVWELLSAIPYGQTTTYAALARQIAKKRGIARMSAQAVGGAVGRNPVSIIVPCHRVIGTDGKLTGYAGGLDRKEALLRLEGIYQET